MANSQNTLLRRRIFSFTIRHSLFAICLLLGGCFSRKHIKSPGDPEVGVNVGWLGHSCFRIEDSVGRQFLIDPFDETVGYTMVWSEPDAVLVTHAHFDHDHLAHAAGYELVDSTGVHTAAGVEVTGLLAFHDNEGGAKNGTTRMYVWEMGGLRLAHLGDLGQTSLSPDQLEALRNVDVLFIPVGGKTTVDAPQAADLARIIGPRAVVPMHYGNEKVRFFQFDPVDPFLALFDNTFLLPDSSFQIRKADLPETTTVYVPRIPD